MLTLRSLAVLAALSLAAPAFAEGIEVHDAYAIASRPDAPSGAAFMTIHNHGGPPDRLIGVRSEVAARTELHAHVAGEDGMMQMVHVTEGWALPTEGQLLLTRGGDHVMFMGLTEPFVDGMTFDLTLIFEVAGEVTVTVPVDLTRLGGDGMGAEEMDHDSMDHGSMDHGAMGHGADHAAVVDQTGMTDADAITAVLMAAFDTPDNPLTVDPVVIEGDHALASWAQGDAGGRALLARGHHGWAVVLCGGADLRLPSFLAEHGVSAADRLSALYNAAEEAIGPEKVALSSSFEGIVMIAAPTH